MHIKKFYLLENTLGSNLNKIKSFQKNNKKIDFFIWSINTNNKVAYRSIRQHDFKSTRNTIMNCVRDDLDEIEGESSKQKLNNKMTTNCYF